MAVGQELRARAGKDKKGYKDSNFNVVTQFIQQQGKGGIFDSQIAQIAGDLTVKPLPPYQFFVYLMRQEGLRELTEAYIASRFPAP